MADCIGRFNKYIKKLIDIADSSTDLDKSYILAANSFFESTLNTVPTVFMDHIGPVLKKNEELIFTKNDSIFKSISSEINSYYSDKSGSEKENITTVINNLKNKWDDYSPEEKDCIFKILKVLISEYNKFNSS